ncbi:MAG: SHOCT domain-containing protein [Bacteroidales bacterium]|nr:SHOCT domain-containing protein [Bacteroidales bacterium]
MTPKQIEELQKLKQLLDSGVINQQEFESEKQKLLNETNSNVSNSPKKFIISCVSTVAILTLIMIMLYGNNAPKESENSEISQEAVNQNENEENCNNPGNNQQPGNNNHHYVLTNILKENAELIGGGVFLKDRTSYEFILPENTSRWFLEFCFGQVPYSEFGMYNTLNENLDTKEGLPDDILSKIPQPQGKIKCTVMILDEENNRKFINLQPFEPLYNVSYEPQGLFELTSVLRSGKYYLAMRNSVSKRYYFNSEIVAIIDKNN